MSKQIKSVKILIITVKFKNEEGYDYYEHKDILVNQTLILGLLIFIVNEGQLIVN